MKKHNYVIYYIIYYNPYTKAIDYLYADDYRLNHINKYGRLTVAYYRDSLIVKKQNMLFVNSGGLPNSVYVFCDMLTKIYNPNKDKLSQFTKENYPELYI
ncbi:MAG: hypothetical protein BV456_03950 [Thermoplasmata archaeon M8B2D]|nr:MAG: hypothetical protein BV456_03950 [Thermoplasmata archaeon M8B2D]